VNFILFLGILDNFLPSETHSFSFLVQASGACCWLAIPVL